MPPVWKGDAGLIDQSDGGQWVFSDEVTYTRVLRGPYALCLSSAPGKGAIGTGIASGLRVRESRVTRDRGGVGTLVIVFASGGESPWPGATLPPDEAQIGLEKIERSIDKHSRYASLSRTMIDQITTLLETGWNGPEHQYTEPIVFGNTLATELYQKKQRGFLTYLFYAPVYRLTTHSWTPPTSLSTGGMIETPPSVPIAPPAGYQWLREGDATAFNGTHWQVTKSWIGAPDWDNDIY